MKKLLLMALVLLVSGAVQAQGSKMKVNHNSFLAFHAGPSFPVSDFGSTNVGNMDAGMAKTGYSINLNYGYQVMPNFGIAAGAFYNKNAVKDVNFGTIDDGSGHNLTLNLDHWQFYGITAGPMLTLKVSDNINTDLRVMGGIVNANGPKISYQGQVKADEDWSVAAVFQTGLNLRIGVADNIFIFTGADFMYLKPEFKYSYNDIDNNPVTEKIQQKMTDINVTAGIGFKF